MARRKKSVVAVQILDIDEFVSLAKGAARCYFNVEFDDGRVYQTLYAEAPARSKEADFIVFVVRRVITPRVLRYLEEEVGFELGDGDFEDRAYRACLYFFEEFMEDLRVRTGLEVKKGRYFVGLRPVSVA